MRSCRVGEVQWLRGRGGEFSEWGFVLYEENGKPCVNNERWRCISNVACTSSGGARRIATQSFGGTALRVAAFTLGAHRIARGDFLDDELTAELEACRNAQHSFLREVAPGWVPTLAYLFVATHTWSSRRSNDRVKVKNPKSSGHETRGAGRLEPLI